jgi:predicted transglutaminase-like cysteine proteinase
MPLVNRGNIFSWPSRSQAPPAVAAGRDLLQRPGRLLLPAGLLLVCLLLFGGLGRAAPDFDLMAQLADQRFGLEGRRAVIEWRDFLADAAELAPAEQLGAVNEFFNRRISFGDDIDIWGQVDYWATPMETLGMRRGDCEDFAIAKYVSLKLLGLPAEKLRLIYVRARIGGSYSQVSQAHMVLSYYPTPTSEPLILDNLISEIRPAGQRPDLLPVFSFNLESLWVGDASAPAAEATARLSRWRDVVQRMRDEGLASLVEKEAPAES